MLHNTTSPTEEIITLRVISVVIMLWLNGASERKKVVLSFCVHAKFILIREN